MSSNQVPTGASSAYTSPRHATLLPPMNAAKPSLPPLRSILAEPFASPPATPTTSRQSLQITPPESDGDYSRAHKRGCSSLAWERRPSYTSPASHQAALPPVDFSQRRDSATQASLDLSSYRQSKDAPYARHRLSNAFLPEPRAPAYEQRTASPERVIHLPRPTTLRKRSFDSLAGPASYDRQPAQTAWSKPPTAQPVGMRPTYQAPSPPPYRPYSTSGAPVARLEYHGHAVQRPVPAQYTAVPELAGPSASSYSRPGVYDYQLAKARKRSNLPKESTDIMKRWFEDHLDNPYPSEDEKKFFAQKAGINLTQVSNWFINHRRRCPELRETRDKKSTTGRRTETDSP
ncbi:homeobox KN domain-containing protein 1 [Elsinoe australis]|uniref:Homeobox KN domain-containing protein 1 n=1 Tax=Elsinoe australis TaxID=40998 RepID=A0A4U7BG68_9PEZI|nr:homeobox KN domain-containing protein 1 [Elsinoe australis]